MRIHSPFSASTPDSLVAIDTGLVADASVNCDNAYEIGRAAAATIVNTPFSDVKLKRNDRVKTISGAVNTVKIRGQSVVVNPTLLFNRITCVMQSRSEMEEFLSYELAPQPTSLFNEGTMRKTAKSTLSALLRSNVTPQSTFPEDAGFVIDRRLPSTHCHLAFRCNVQASMRVICIVRSRALWQRRHNGCLWWIWKSIIY